jgi:hypothetical protein
VARTLQLYQLQALDSEIDKINQQLANIAAKLGENAALKDARSRTEQTQQTLRKAHAAMQNLDLEVKSLADKISNQEKRLYSGSILNAKEAANLQEEVASLQRRHSEREERLLEAMLELEEAEEGAKAAQAALTKVEAEWAANQKDLKQAQAELEGKLTEFMERRPAVAGVVDAEALGEYESLRPKKGGRAIVIVKDGVCQGCGMTLSNSRIQHARAGTELTYCSTCGRILYVP